jgi:SAM-dependent methyltransferase
VSSPQHCVACGSGPLAPHLQVAGEAGEQGLIPTTDRFGTALSDIVRCLNCGHMQLERFPAETDLSEAYAEAESEEYVEEEAGQRVTAQSTLDQIERFTSRGALLDLGCWVGFLLDEARARGWEAKGVEPSEFASQHARDVLGLDVETSGLLEANLPERHFQAVFLGDVIEHLPDPGQALDRIASLLTDDGVVAMALPDAGSRLAKTMGRRWWSVIPTHVQYFTRGSMRTLLGRHDYRPLLFTTAPKTFSVRYYVSRVGGYRPGIANAISRAADRLRVGDKLWTPDFRDRMLVISRRA